MLDGLKKKAKKVIEAGKEAVETKFCIKKDGRTVAVEINKNDVDNFLKNEYGIEIMEQE